MRPGRILIRGGTVLTMDPALGDLPGADVLIEGDTIAAVGADLDAAGAEAIDASDAIVLPGLVDTHRHTWQLLLRGICADWTLGDYFLGIRLLAAPLYTPDDLRLANQLGALEALDAGVTTLLDFSHCNVTPAHADAALEGFVAAGIRGLHCHGFFEPAPGASAYGTHAARLTDFRRLAAAGPPSDLVELGVSVSETGGLPLRDTEAEIRTARELGARMVFHTGCLWGSAATGGIAALHERGLLGPDQVHVHCNALDDDDWKRLADAGAHVSISPETELGMGMGRLAIEPCRRHGIEPTLSADVVSLNSGDLFAQMRIALAYQRQLENDPLNQAGAMPERLVTRARDVLHMATLAGARACGLGDVVGSLTPGKRADVVVIGRAPGRFGLVPRPDPVGSAVFQATPADVRTVLVNGVVRKRDGRLVDVDLDGLLDRAERASARIVAAMRERSPLPPPAPPGLTAAMQRNALAHLADVGRGTEG